MATQKQTPEKNVAVQKPRTGRQTLPSRYDDIFGQSFLPAWWGNFLSDRDMWAPAINVLEKEDKYIAKVELPGVHEEDVNVSIVGDTLVIEGEKEAESEVKKKAYYYSETSYGSFSRSIPIPSSVDAEKIAANFDKGVLEIDLPKAVEIKPKKVGVTTKKKAKTAAKEKTVPSRNEKEGSKKT
jgi:HSP20 family protein